MSNSGGVVQGSGRRGGPRFFVRPKQEDWSPWRGFVVGRDGIRPLEWLVGKQVQGMRLAVSGAQGAEMWRKAACWEPGWVARLKVWRDLDALFIEETGPAGSDGALASLRSLTPNEGADKMVAGVYLGLVRSGRGRPRPYWIFVGDGQ